MNTYERDGYQLIRQAIPPTDLQPFRQCIQTQVGIHAQQLMEVGDIDGLYEDLPFGHRLAALHVDNELRLRSWNQPVLGPELHALIHHLLLLMPWNLTLSLTPALMVVISVA